MYVVGNTREETSECWPKYFNIEGHGGPQTYDEAMKAQDVSFWRRTIQHKIDLIMGSKTGN